jgi:ferredoxin
MKRKIIEIDRELCNGCARCTTACAEGALELDAEGKAFLAREIFCDGLGACLDVCPTGALKIIEREAPAFDEAAATQFQARAGMGQAAPASRPALMSHNAIKVGPAAHAGRSGPQWPIQLHLVSPQAPYFHECDLLIAADCTAFALGSFHPDLLRGKALAIACPKLDRLDGYVDKLAELIASNTVYSITVAIMEVPCCTGLSRIVAEAVEKSGKSIAIKTMVVGLNGSLRK